MAKSLRPLQQPERSVGQPNLWLAHFLVVVRRQVFLAGLLTSLLLPEVLYRMVKYVIYTTLATAHCRATEQRWVGGLQTRTNNWRGRKHRIMWSKMHA